MINKTKVLGLLGLATKAGKISFGIEACKDMVIKKKAKLIIIAEDAADRTKKQMKELCIIAGIRYLEFGTIKIISQSIGKVNKAVIAIREESFSKAIIKVIDGGDMIG